MTPRHSNSDCVSCQQQNVTNAEKSGLLTAIRVGKLTVLEKYGIKNNSLFWYCQCDCGQITLASTYQLRSGSKKSCGCSRKEFLSISSKKQSADGIGAFIRSHGLTKHSLYKTWLCMMQRCYHANNPKFSDYGGRGIYVCERWHNISNFIEDMGDRPKDHTLDRKDNNGPYNPENCRWATLSEQGRNRRENYDGFERKSNKPKYIEYEGLRLTVSQWAKRIGIHRGALSSRIKNGWPLEKALTTGKRGNY